MINQWLKNSIPSLSDMVHVGRGPHIDYFYSLTNFGKQHHSYLTDFWQNASTNFLDEIGFLTTFCAQDLEKSIIWRYRLSRVCPDIAGDFKPMLSKIIEMKMGISLVPQRIMRPVLKHMAQDFLPHTFHLLSTGVGVTVFMTLMICNF